MLTSDHLLAQVACETFGLSATSDVFLTLYLNSGEVFQGTWNKMPVALKVLKSGGVAASSTVRPSYNYYYRSYMRHLTFTFYTQAICREIDVRILISYFMVEL